VATRQRECVGNHKDLDCCTPRHYDGADTAPGSYSADANGSKPLDYITCIGYKKGLVSQTITITKDVAAALVGGYTDHKDLCSKLLAIK
jgi:hypothetical protein